MRCRTMDHANVETTARVGLRHSRPKLELFFSNANIFLMFLAKQDYWSLWQAAYGGPFLGGAFDSPQLINGQAHRP